MVNPYQTKATKPYKDNKILGIVLKKVYTK